MVLCVNAFAFCVSDNCKMFLFLYIYIILCACVHILLFSEKIQFGLMSGRDIERMSVVEVTHDTLYNQPKRTPYAFGPLDLRMVI